MINDLKRKLLIERTNKSALVPVMTTFIGELERMQSGNKLSIGHDVVVQVAKKFIENNKECIEAAPNNTALIEKLETENNWLKTLIPEQIGIDELTKYANEYATIGEYMKFLNSKFPGKFDRSLAALAFRTVH